MEKKEVTVANPVAVGEATLIPVIEVSLNCARRNGGISLFGAKQPVAVVVVSASARTAFRITGEEVSIAQLIREFPNIKEEMEAI
jgi:uncharacterized spore protein YtfJ